MGIVLMVFAIVFGIIGWKQCKRNIEDEENVFLNGQKVAGKEADQVRRYGMFLYYGVTVLFFLVGACMTLFSMLHISFNPVWIFPGVFLLVGFVFVLVGIVIRTVNKKVDLEGMTVLGTIEGVEREEDMDFDQDLHIHYVPVVRYYFHGKEYCGKALMGNRNPKRYPIGEKVEIQLNPEVPEMFHLGKDNDTARQIYRVFSAVGILCCIIGFVAVIFLTLR